MYMYSTLLRIALRVSTCIIHVQLAESRPEGQCFGGYLYYRVKQSSFGIVAGTGRASSSSLLVTLNNV